MFTKIAGPRFFGYPDLSKEKEAVLKLDLQKFFETFAGILKDTNYVARTDGPTIADIFAYNEFVNAHRLGIDLNEFPIIKAWYDEIGRINEVNEVCRSVIELIEKNAYE